MKEETYRIEMKKRATDDRLERECKPDCPSLLSKGEITRLKFLEIFKAENQQEPRFAHVLIVVNIIVHETLLLVYVRQTKKVLCIDHFGFYFYVSKGTGSY